MILEGIATVWLLVILSAETAECLSRCAARNKTDDLGIPYYKAVNLKAGYENFEEAEEACATRLPGGRLASVACKEEEKHLLWLMKATNFAKGDCFLVGLKQQSNGRWLWSDDAGSRYQKWARGYPKKEGGNCACYGLEENKLALFNGNCAHFSNFYACQNNTLLTRNGSPGVVRTTPATSRGTPFPGTSSPNPSSQTPQPSEATSDPYPTTEIPCETSGYTTSTTPLSSESTVEPNETTAKPLDNSTTTVSQEVVATTAGTSRGTPLPGTSSPNPASETPQPSEATPDPYPTTEGPSESGYTTSRTPVSSESTVEPNETTTNPLDNSTTTVSQGSKPPCESDWVVFENHCYKEKKESLSEKWIATLNCEAHGALLASINSVKEAEFLVGLSRRGSESGDRNHPWIGLQKRNGDWKWDDNSTAEVQWANHVDPNDNSKLCARLTVFEPTMDFTILGKVENYDCNATTNRFFCKRPI